jgi:hypothetical protein
MGERRAIFVREIDGIQVVAVNIERELILSAVPNAHRH